MIKVLLFIWQLPQNLFGLFILLLNCRSAIKKNGYWLVKHLSNAGISLGGYVIIDLDAPVSNFAILHERGHQKQSEVLGPLYLLVIGLPSLIGNIINRVFHRKWSKLRKSCWYYNLPWEKNANNLSGISYPYWKSV